MEHLFSTALAFRGMLVSALEDLDEASMDIVPEGFNNNIRWNLAHLVVTPGLLTYRLAGKDIPLLSVEFIDSCKKGSCPDDLSLNEDYSKQHLCELLIETTKQAQRDFEDLSKESFKAYETSTGFVIQDLASAFSYSNIHDGLHIGHIRLLKKTIEAGA